MTILPFLWKSRGKAGMKLERKWNLSWISSVLRTAATIILPSCRAARNSASVLPAPLLPILKVLLCDEATSALDPQTTESILELLRDINKRLHITIVMITHQMNVVKEICDHVAVIEGGRIIEEGPLYEVFTNPKNPTTKEFVASTRTDIVPELVKKLDLHKEYTSGDKALVRLHFLGDSAGEPVITVLIKKYDIDVNILSGNVETLQDTPYGTLLIGMDGDEAHLKEALSYLEGQKLQIEVIGYVK